MNLGVVDEAVARPRAWLSAAFVPTAAVPWRSQDVEVELGVVERAVTVTVQVVKLN